MLLNYLMYFQRKKIIRVTVIIRKYCYPKYLRWNKKIEIIVEYSQLINERSLGGKKSNKQSTDLITQ